MGIFDDIVWSSEYIVFGREWRGKTSTVGAGYMAWHVVQQGDCFNSIAKEEGFFWSTLWNAAENSDLKQKRKDPDVLMEGDKVFIPDIRTKDVPEPVEQRHEFVRKGVPAMLRLKLMDADHNPRANKKYVLTIDGNSVNGQTDGDGLVVHSIPPNAQKGTLDVDLGDRILRHDLKLGHLNPSDDLSGVQHRLKNLGYTIPDESGEMDDHTTTALKQFQQDYKLNESGEADDATVSKLKDVHGG